MISTNKNVHIESFPRKAGIESGRLFNDWLDCPFKIEPVSPSHPARGFRWMVQYKATDTASDAGGFHASATLFGYSRTRTEAARAVIHYTTLRINNVVEARKSLIRRQHVYDQISVEAGIPLAPRLLFLGTLDGIPAVMRPRVLADNRAG